MTSVLLEFLDTHHIWFIIKSIELKDLPLEKQLFLSNFNIKNYKQFMDIYIEKQLLTKEIKSQNDEIEAIKGKHKI